MSFSISCKLSKSRTYFTYFEIKIYYNQNASKCLVILFGALLEYIYNHTITFMFYGTPFSSSNKILKVWRTMLEKVLLEY